MTAESSELQQRNHEVSLVLSFSPSLAPHLADGLADYLQQQLRKSFHVRRAQLTGSRKRPMPVLVATAKEQALEAEAESLGVMKEDLHGKRRYFRVRACAAEFAFAGRRVDILILGLKFCGCCRWEKSKCSRTATHRASSHSTKRASCRGCCWI
jgi:hypothetical protein